MWRTPTRSAPPVRVRSSPCGASISMLTGAPKISISFDRLGALRLALGAAGEGARDVHQRAAAGMQVDGDVGHRQQHRLDEMRDHLRRPAIGIAGEGAVEIALVDRRGAHAGHRRRVVGGGQDDDAALDVVGLEAPRQLHQRDLALVLVAVIAGDQQDGRTLAVLDAGDRHREPAIGRAMHRMRQAQKGRLLARPCRNRPRNEFLFYSSRRYLQNLRFYV